MGGVGFGGLSLRGLTSTIISMMPVLTLSVFTNNCKAFQTFQIFVFFVLFKMFPHASRSIEFGMY
jgi:hypothetical protein